MSDNIIDRHRGNDNTILFAMDEVEWRRIRGLEWEHYREQFVAHWKECYVKPGLYLRAPGHTLRQSHDNIFAWFRCFKVFGLEELSTQLMRELDMMGWQLYETDGRTFRKEGIMPPFVEVFCRMIHTDRISSLQAVYLLLHMIHAKFKTTWNLEFHRYIAIQEIEAVTLPERLTRLLSSLLFGFSDWEGHALGYHGNGGPIPEIVNIKKS